MNKAPLTISCKGYEIAADWYANESADKILLVIMGYGSSKERNADLIAEVAEQSEVSALALDLSGHGDSPFDLHNITPAQHVLEVLTAFDWLRNEYPDANISVMGTSYGGYMASWLSRFRNFDRLILRTPAIYKSSDFYTPHAHIEKAKQLALYRNDAGQVARNPLFLQEPVFNGPTLLVVHENDEDIPVATSDVYKDAYSAETYLAKGFRHSFRDVANPSDGAVPYRQTLVAWLKK